MKTCLRRFIGLLCLSVSPALAQVTTHSTIITTDETWGAGTHYIDTDVLLVTSGATLTIEAGAVVKFGFLSTLSIRNARLNVDGTSGNEVVFTSMNDDAIGEPITGSNGTPQPSDWGGLLFARTSGMTARGTFAYCHIRYNESGINIGEGTSVAFSHGVIEKGHSWGFLGSGNLTLRDSRVSDNGDGGFSFTGNLDLGTEVDPGNNVFRDNGDYDVRNTVGTGFAMSNYWGVATEDEIRARIYRPDNLYYTPWLTEPPIASERTFEGTLGADGADAGWRLLSAPVKEATRADLADDVTFSTSSGEMFYTWDGAWVAGSNTTALTSGTGFMLYLFDDATDPIDPSLTLDVPGTVPVDPVPVAVDAAQQLHLLGNPYDTSYDLSSLDLDPAFFHQVVSIYNPSTGSYVPLTRGAGSSDVIAPWQGFFAERTVPGEGPSTLTFSLAGRTTGGTFVGKQAAQMEMARRLGLRLDVTDEAGKTLAVDESTTLYFCDGATAGWDAWDATKLVPPMRKTYALLAFEGEHRGTLVRKAQESLPLDLAQTAELPLSVDARGVSGRAVLSWPTWGNVPAGWGLSLVDTRTGEHIDMRLQTKHAFDVAASDEAASDEAAARFILRIAPGTTTDVENVDLPVLMALGGNFPNPFTGSTTLRYTLPGQAAVRLSLYDLLGRRVETIVDEVRPAGNHEAVFHAGGHPPGVYVYRLEAGGEVRMGKMVLAR